MNDLSRLQEELLSIQRSLAEETRLLKTQSIEHAERVAQVQNQTADTSAKEATESDTETTWGACPRTKIGKLYLRTLVN